MNKKEMVKMAVKAGFLSNMDADYIISPYCSDDMDLYKELKLFAKLIAQKEREECAKLCDESEYPDGIDLAYLIRARGQE